MTNPALVTGAPVSVPRRLAGWVVAAVTVAAAGLFALGIGNPLRLGVLERYFFDPLFGMLLVGLAGYLALWLLLPIRNEAAQGRRIVARVATLVLAGGGLVGWGIFGVFFNQEVTEVAQSSDGSRALVEVVHANNPFRYELRVWNGTGLTAREAGSLGEACGGVQAARFVTEDRVELDTTYGTWQFDLDPATGAPQQVLGPRCPDGPVPARMEP
ncbi:MAG: hypothetical protein GEV12_15955 [Micromonosporaceae bacterium]|nr:hypothetical protein [Micromonosporaceae bacterium]